MGVGPQGKKRGEESIMEKIEKRQKWLVVKCWPNEDVECGVDEGDALEVIERQEHAWNDVALIPLEKVLDAIRDHQKIIKNTKEQLVNETNLSLRVEN